MHCATRWIYDYPILRFIFDHIDNVQMIFADLEHSCPNQITPLLPLLEQVFSTVRQFEFDCPSLAIGYPGVEELITFLTKQGDKIRCRKLRKVSRDCAAIIRERTLDTTNYIFQLAFVLTPAGREQARAEIFGQRSDPTDRSERPGAGDGPAEDFPEEEDSTQGVTAGHRARKADEGSETDDTDPSSQPSLCPRKRADTDSEEGDDRLAKEDVQRLRIAPEEDESP
jgi:hypothetical protein